MSQNQQKRDKETKCNQFIKPSSAISQWVKQFVKRAVNSFNQAQQIILQIGNAQPSEEFQSFNQQKSECLEQVPGSKESSKQSQLDRLKLAALKMAENINSQIPSVQVFIHDLQNYQEESNIAQLQLEDQNRVGQEGSISEVRGFCEDLKDKSRLQVHSHSNIQQLVSAIEELHQNNSYWYLQEGFEILKHLKRIDQNVSQQPTGQNRLNKKDSGRRSEASDQEINLELTFKSRNSNTFGKSNATAKQSLERHDSLVYSNATSFGLQSTQNRSSGGKGKNQAKFKGKINDEEDIQMLVAIDRTSSRGEVEGDLSSKSLSQKGRNRAEIHEPPRFSYKNQSRHRLTSKSSASSTDQKGGQHQQNAIFQPILQQENYEVQKIQSDLVEPEIKETPVKEKVKTTFSIKKSSNKFKGSKDVPSVFNQEIESYELKINRIKQAKMLKKKKLQEELAKINMEIKELKHQESDSDPENHEFQQTKPPIPSPKVQANDVRRRQDSQESASGPIKNTYQSRVQINDDLKSKEKAEVLVKNLRSQRRNRQLVKKNETKVLDRDLHEQMEEIMKMKYFNEERLKQKKKLEIIERMKQQELRKIGEHKKKQLSSNFLLKLKHNPPQRSVAGGSVFVSQNKSPELRNQTNKRAEEAEYQEEIQRDHNAGRQRQEVTPGVRKRVDSQQSQEVNLVLSRKREYSNKSKNFTIIKKPALDVYEQSLR